MEEFGIDSISRTEALDFQADYEYELDQITMIPEIRQLLRHLHENQIPIGILTNGPVDLQSRKLKLIGAYQYFKKENIIISQTTGYSKPQQEIFDYTAKELNFSPSESLYIGDTFINDIEGSYNARWHPIWFNHRNRQIAKEKEEMPVMRSLVQVNFEI
ncbi:MAG: HAD family hydrolase [Streptococcus salivarius]